MISCPAWTLQGHQSFAVAMTIWTQLASGEDAALGQPA